MPSGRTAFPEVESPVRTRTETPVGKDRRADEPKPDDLLALAKDDPEGLAKRLKEEWEQSTKDIQSYNEQWKVNLARSEGYLGARLDKVQDRQEAWIPYGAGPSITGLNKAERQSRRLRSYIFADPPVPEAVPSTGKDVSADNAEFQGRILKDESSEGRLGYDILSADAFEVAKDYGSGFLHFYIDPEGRGPEPVQIKAHPDATSADDPLLKQPVEGAAPPSQKPPILKYITATGELTTERYGQPLQQHFLPKLCAAVWTGRHVRMFPNTARDLWDATGCWIGAMVPLADVKALHPSVAKLSDEELTALVRYRPNKAEELLPMEQRKYLNHTDLDRALVFRLLRYELSTQSSRHGSYIALIGDNHIAYAGEWWDKEHDEPLDLPVTQFMQYRQHGNRYGKGSTETLGPGSEIMALILDAMLEHMDRFGDAKVFVPTTSSVRPEQLEAESHRYIPVSPQGQPVSEVIPDFPITMEKMYGRISGEMDDESGLQASGQALQAPNIKSARHFQANLQQVQVLLSDLRQNTARGLTRGWRIMSQQMRSFYTIPQLLRWEGEDGAYHVKEWAGADLVGLGDVQIAPGSFTQMLPAQKAAVARELFLTDRALTPEQYKRIVFGQFNAVLAIEQDPHFQRVKRQIDRWLEGPPQGWQPPQPQLPSPEVMPPGPPQNAGAAAPAPSAVGSVATGAAVSPPVTPPDPLLTEIFDVRPADDEPQVAAVRMQELGRTMATSKFSRFPPEWQQGLVQAYVMARQAAQVPDAKQAQQIQDQLKEAQAKLQKPHLSMSVPLAPLDPAQTAVVLQQEGLQVPAPAPPVIPPAVGPRRHRLTRQPDGSMIAEPM